MTIKDRHFVKYLFLITLSLIIVAISHTPTSAGIVDKVKDLLRPGKKPTRTVAEVIKKIKPRALPFWEKEFTQKDLEFPPKKLAFVVIKDEDILEVWGMDKNGKRTLVNEYNVLAASGGAGPKLKQGDHQVPEGLYSIIWLHPNSSYHLSMKINYPSKFDREMAKKDKRTNLGGDIFIHGSFLSVGCLAMGDSAIEELFYLVNKVGQQNVSVIIAPYDFRIYDRPFKVSKKVPAWVEPLYEKVKREMAKYRKSK